LLSVSPEALPPEADNAIINRVIFNNKLTNIAFGNNGYYLRCSEIILCFRVNISQYILACSCHTKYAIGERR